MNFIEEIFHRISPRGVTESELASSSSRRRLQALYEKLAEKLGSLRGERLVNAVALSTQMVRHLQTYPETASELAAWEATAANLTREARKYVGLNPLVVGLVLGGGIAAVGAFMLLGRR